MRPSSYELSFLVPFLLIWATPGSGQELATLDASLAARFGLSADDLRDLSKGKLVVNVPKSEDEYEVEVIGAIRVDAPVGFLIERLREVEAALLADEVVLSSGLFSQIPDSGDLQDLELAKSDIKALRDCKPGACNFKLTAPSIERIRSQVDWSRSGHEVEARALVAGDLAEMLRAYIARGETALPIYGDKPEPLAVADGFRILRDNVRPILEQDAELAGFLADLTGDRWPQVETTYYWSVEDYGVRPVITLNHVVVMPTSGGNGHQATMAVKHLYASHYIHAGFKIAMLASVSEAQPEQGTYYLLFMRLRFDAHVTGLKRLLLRSRVRETWEDQLKSWREDSEKSFRALVTPG